MTRPRSLVLTVLVALAATGALTGCAPTEVPGASPSPSAPSPSASSASPSPSPEPTRPALDELELSADGLGPLLLGAPPEDDPELSMVAYDSVACTDAVTGEEWGIEEGEPGAALWRTDPSYTASSPAYGPGIAFGVSVSAEGALQRVELYSADIPTDGGIRIGDPGESVASAHPGATIVPDYLTDIHVIDGSGGSLLIEVAKNADDLGDYWGDQVGTVVYIRAVTADLGVFSVAASGNVVGVCGA